MFEAMLSLGGFIFVIVLFLFALACGVTTIMAPFLALSDIWKGKLSRAAGTLLIVIAQDSLLLYLFRMSGLI